MAYLDNLFGPHAGNLNRALNKTSERQSLLMKNLANVNTPGYKREDMDFSIMLDEKMDEFDTMVAERSLKSKRSSESSLRPDKNNVDLEMEAKENIPARRSSVSTDPPIVVIFCDCVLCNHQFFIRSKNPPMLIVLGAET